MRRDPPLRWGETSIATFEGIEARVVSDDAGGAYPFPLSGGVQLVVDESDREAAAAVLAGR